MGKINIHWDIFLILSRTVKDISFFGISQCKHFYFVIFKFKIGIFSTFFKKFQHFFPKCRKSFYSKTYLREFAKIVNLSRALFGGSNGMQFDNLAVPSLERYYEMYRKTSLRGKKLAEKVRKYLFLNCNDAE